MPICWEDERRDPLCMPMCTPAEVEQERLAAAHGPAQRDRERVKRREALSPEQIVVLVPLGGQNNVPADVRLSLGFLVALFSMCLMSSASASAGRSFLGSRRSRGGGGRGGPGQYRRRIDTPTTKFTRRDRIRRRLCIRRRWGVAVSDRAARSFLGASLEDLLPAARHPLDRDTKCCRRFR